MKYVVICGYCGPDHYTNSDGPVLELHEFSRPDQVEAFASRWQEEVAENPEVSQRTFRVFEVRQELKLVPKESVTLWKLESK